jgi:4-hydroxy-3-methylbut-2-enyl diphosphate reductase
MRVTRARSAGFCLGVSLALKRLDRELAAHEKEARTSAARLFTLGPIIHNPLVMRQYAARGVLCADSPADIRPGDRVVIRAHGIPRELEARLAASGAAIADATCPKVKKAQTAIGKTAARGGRLLLFGERDHPEVRGLLSYAGQSALVFGALSELEALDLEPGLPYFLAAQTTQERALFLEARDRVRQRLGREVKTLDTICDATRDRQQEVLDLCRTARSMVVVGGFNSGNTRRLAEVARSAGLFAVHAEQPDDISPGDIARLRQNGDPIGLTAGASTPQEHIDAMRAFLEKI